MFPPELATGPMSLVQGKVCFALSFGVILDETGGVKEYEIHPTLIKPTYRLTYDDVDEMLQLGLQNEPEIAELAKQAQLRREWRKSQGSIQIKMPESVIKVKDDDEVTIELIDSSRSRQLVAEMMILAGQLGGMYGTEHNLPLPYRGQPQPELPSEEELLKLPAGPARFCALRSCMPRSEMSMSPIRHASLGLDSYVQVTSPIRRYTDLLAHFQIKAHLRGEELPFSREELQEIVYSVSNSSYEATLVERQTNRYWGLEYLRRNAECVWPVLVLRWLREDENLGLILIEDLGMELPHRFDRPVALGDRLEMQVTRADPQRDEVRLREITEAEIQATPL
jgi:exoribonuclease II